MRPYINNSSILVNKLQSNKFFIILKILISVLLILFIFKFKLNINDLLLAWRKANINFLLLALISTAGVVLIKAIKWQLIINQNLHSNINYKDSLTSYLFGLGPALFTPGKLGEILRISKIKNLPKITLSELFIVDKITEFSVIFFLSSIGAYLIHLKMIAEICLAIFLVSNLIFFWRQSAIAIIKKLILKFSKKEINFNSTEISSSNYLLYTFLAGSSLFLDITAFYFILNAFEKLSFSHSLLVFPIIMISAVIPISLFGLGVRETTAIYLLANFNISSQASFNSSILIFVIGSVIPALVGVFIGDSWKISQRG